jgi:hypothetical protein
VFVLVVAFVAVFGHAHKLTSLMRWCAGEKENSATYFELAWKSMFQKRGLRQAQGRLSGTRLWGRFIRRGRGGT